MCRFPSCRYRLETTLNYGMERVWTLAVSPSSNKVAVGYDEGTVVLQLGHERPVASMDRNGRVIWAENNAMQMAVLRGVADESKAEDGQVLDLDAREVGNSELFPQFIKHNSNGRFVAVCGDGEYVIYTAQRLRNKSFGSALGFVWSAFGAGNYAVRESSSRIVVYKNFNTSRSFRPSFSAEQIFGGVLIGVRSNDFVCFYDWEADRLVRRIDEVPHLVSWSENGDLVVLATKESFFVLRYDASSVAAAAHAEGEEAKIIEEEGVEAAFDLAGPEVNEQVRSGVWVGDCFVYTNHANRLNYYVGGKVVTVAHLDKPLHVLGYLPKENRVYLVDKSQAISSYKLQLSILRYQTAVVRGDFEDANAILAEIPEDQYNAIASFLEAQGFKEEALMVATDPDQKFELAIELQRLDVRWRKSHMCCRCVRRSAGGVVSLLGALLLCPCHKDGGLVPGWLLTCPSVVPAVPPFLAAERTDCDGDHA